MQIFRRVTKPVAYLVSTGLLALSLYVPVTQASLVSTDVAIAANQAQQVREHLHAMLDREDVKQALGARGVGADEVQARVDALSDQEAQQLATDMDRMPAGGTSVILIAAVVFVVLLVTDILGFTDIFPFVKKPARH